VAKFVLREGWKFPVYEVFLILFGGGLVAAGVVVGKWSASPGSAVLAPTLQAQTQPQTQPQPQLEANPSAQLAQQLSQQSAQQPAYAAAAPTPAAAAPAATSAATSASALNEAAKLSDEELARKMDQIMNSIPSAPAPSDVIPEPVLAQPEPVESKIDRVEERRAPPQTPAVNREAKVSGRKPYFTFQVGVFLNKNGAAEVAKSLERKGLKPFTEVKTLNGRTLYYVFVGRFDMRDTAMDFQSTLTQTAGVKSFLTYIP